MTRHTFDTSLPVAAKSARLCGNDRNLGRLGATVVTATIDSHPLAERAKP